MRDSPEDTTSDNDGGSGSSGSRRPCRPPTDPSQRPLPTFVPHFTRCQMEALFYPKFDNDQPRAGAKRGILNHHDTTTNNNNNNDDHDDDDARTTTSVLRQRILQSFSRTCTSTDCNNHHHHHHHHRNKNHLLQLEVSLKHSGSLLLWSGGDRYYSKHSCHNAVTGLGEIVLRQHFARAWWSSSVDRPTNHPPLPRDDWEAPYHRCSDYIQQHHLTLAFEVVTSSFWLGDHGQRPHRDYIILLAVVQRPPRSSSSSSSSFSSPSSSSSPHFYSTTQLVQFAQEHRLPHNDIYVFSKPSSVHEFFRCCYDTMRCHGTAATVLPALHRLAEVHLESMYPHLIFQGDLLEGLVVRLVRQDGGGDSGNGNSDNDSDDGNDDDGATKHETDHETVLQRLAQRSRDLLAHVPPHWPDAPAWLARNELPADDQPMGTRPTTVPPPPVLTTDVRSFCSTLTTTTTSSSSGPNQLEVVRRLEDLLQQSSTPRHPRRKIECVSVVRQRPGQKNNNNKHDAGWLHSLLEANESGSKMESTGVVLDTVSTRLTTLLESLIQLEAATDVTLFRETTVPPETAPHGSTTRTPVEREEDACEEVVRWLCTIHVLHDSTFSKFQKQRKPKDLPLYRGFVMELLTETSQSSNQNHGNEQCNNGALDGMDGTRKIIMEDVARTLEEQDQDQQILMVKLKFLPYMVRTMGCRNGLSLIRDGSSPETYLKYTNDCIARWQLPAEERQKLQMFFKAWAFYAKQCFDGVVEEYYPCNTTNPSIAAVALSDQCYLDHFDRFQSLYEQGQIRYVFGKQEEANHYTYRGLVLVLSLDKESCDRAADFIANELRARRVADIKELKPETLLIMQEKGHGAVCSSVLLDGGMGQFRKLLKDSASGVSIVLFQCTECDVKSAYPDDKIRKKVLGMIKGWKNIKCSYVVDLPGSALFVGNSNNQPFDKNEEKEKQLVLDDSFLTAISCLKEVSRTLPVVDYRSGLLVFFPGMPGCGKSSLLDSSTIDAIRQGMHKLDKKATRQLLVSVGDQTPGKFWPHVTTLRLQDPSSVLIADKNVPSGTWETVGKVAATTRAIAVPVIPDLTVLQTTIIHGTRNLDGAVKDSHRTHCYPFALKYLALCMTRVCDRSPGSHVGKLDEGTMRACLIVIKFFTLYRRVTAEEFSDLIFERMARMGAWSASYPVQIPVFSMDSDGTRLPEDFEALLTEAIQIFVSFAFTRSELSAFAPTMLT